MTHDLAGQVLVNWQLIAIICSIFGSLLGALFGAIWWLLDRYARVQERSQTEWRNLIDGRFERLETEIKQWPRLEREILKLKNEFTLYYVAREDWIRMQAVLDRRFERLEESLDLLKGEIRGAV